MSDLEGCTRQPEPLSAVERRRRLCEAIDGGKKFKHFVCGEGPSCAPGDKYGCNDHCPSCALIADHEKEQAGEGWQPIETAPKDVWVLVWTPPRTTVAYRQRHQDRWLVNGGGGLFVAPTHWMPLPSPPTEEKP
jgi:hypothetical protein